MLDTVWTNARVTSNAMGDASKYEGEVANKSLTLYLLRGRPRGIVVK
jgi:hypothetical protein